MVQKPLRPVPRQKKQDQTEYGSPCFVQPVGQGGRMPTFSVNPRICENPMNYKDGVRIRRAKPSDLNSMLDLLRLLFSIEKDFVFDGSNQCRGLAMLLEHDAAVVLVAESRHRVIGMCTGQLVISTAVGGYSLLVEDVVVEACRRGEGTGKFLLENLEAWAVGKGVHRLQLLADRSNDAGLLFYKKNNWQQTNLICLQR